MLRYPHERHLGTERNSTVIVLGIGINITAEALSPDAAMRFPATWAGEIYRAASGALSKLLAEVIKSMQFWRSPDGHTRIHPRPGKTIWPFAEKPSAL